MRSEVGALDKKIVMGIFIPWDSQLNVKGPPLTSHIFLSSESGPRKYFDVTEVPVIRPFSLKIFYPISSLYF